MIYSFTCIDAHTCGNPVRLVKEGGPLLQGNSMSEKRQHFLKEYDWIRKGLMFEPRGHDMMSGSILYPPHDPQNDIAVLFITPMPPIAPSRVSRPPAATSLSSATVSSTPPRRRTTLRSPRFGR